MPESVLAYAPVQQNKTTYGIGVGPVNVQFGAEIKCNVIFFTQTRALLCLVSPSENKLAGGAFKFAAALGGPQAMAANAFVGKEAAKVAQQAPDAILAQTSGTSIPYQGSTFQVKKGMLGASIIVSPAGGKPHDYALINKKDADAIRNVLQQNAPQSLQ